ncbi:chaperone ATPase hsp78 [Lecanora helva]
MYGVDLTAKAKYGKLDPVIGSDTEIQRLIQILSRRTKNNPVLVGSAGTGKTAIMESLAQWIVRGDVPDSMKKRMTALDLGLLIASAKARRLEIAREFEERLKAVLKEVEDAHGSIMLFIDEIHSLLGLGKAEESIDATNLLKSALSRGDLQCCGATTLSEYRQIEKDDALTRRFQPILVGEPSVSETISILRGLKKKYEVHHGVRILDSARVTAANLSNRYVSDRFLPDKAIDLVDEATSAQRLQQESKPNAIQELDRQIMTIQIELESLRKETDIASVEQVEIGKLNDAWNKKKIQIEAIQSARSELESVRVGLEQAQRGGDYGRAPELRYATIPKLEEKLPQEHIVSTTSGIVHDSVTSENIEAVVSRQTGTPVTKLISGQNEALVAVTDAVRSQRAGLSGDDRPIVGFMFLGPTGTGKTLACKLLASFLFSSENAMIRFDISEFQEKHTVSRFIGSPAGYVGYEDADENENPTQWCFSTKFEKAHRDIAGLLLRALDEDYLTYAQGHKVDSRNTIIVLASNISADLFLDSKSMQAESMEISSVIKDAIMARVAANFPPKSINRLD